MKELSVFTDESGDFGDAKERPAYYLVTFVFHNQDNDIEHQVAKLEASMKNAGFDVEYIHTGPVIRREEIFARYSIDEDEKRLSKSEENFFYKPQELKKTFLKSSDKKKL